MIACLNLTQDETQHICAVQHIVNEYAMETHFEQLIDALQRPLPSSNIDLSEVTCILEKQNSELISSFISQLCPSILILEQWAWQVFSQDIQRWVNDADYLQLFQTFATFNKNLIFDYDDIEVNIKASLLIPENDDCIIRIFEELDKLNDDNHTFIRIVSLWFDNLSYFIREYPEFETSPVIGSINRQMARNYVMTDQYKQYLRELHQSPSPQSIFTAKQLFYIKTCSLSLSSYLFAKAQDFIYTAEDIIHHLSADHTQIMVQHTYTMDSWSPELLACVTYLRVLFASCCWWGGKKGIPTKVIFPTETQACDYIDALIRIISFKTLPQCITARRANEQTILLDITLFSMINIAQSQDFIWFLRSKISLPEILMNIAEASPCEKISLCVYGILGEILSDQHLKELKVCDNVINFFFDMLEQAWHHPFKKYKNIPIYYLVQAFVSLSKIDVIQQMTADANKIPLLLEMSEHCLMTFDIVWALSFNADIQRQLRSNTTFMTRLAHLPKQCNNEKMRKITHGILWNLESTHEDRTEVNDGKAFDIMISYSHKDQVLCRRIYNALIKAQYRVWIDFDQMHGNVMDSMAQAIEQSKMVLICMSEQYRRSNYCRAEANYAFQRQLKIVPILLQEHYQPDGWLLFLVGQLLYVDFTRFEFSQAVEMVIKELKAPIISEIGRVSVCLQEEVDIVIPATHTPLQYSSLPVLPENILEWTQSHVHNWLINHGLLQLSHLFANFDGRSLMYMHETIEKIELQQIVTLLQEDCLRRTSQSLSLVEFAQFRSLMEQQKRSPRSNIIVESTRMNVNKLKRKSLMRCRVM